MGSTRRESPVAPQLESTDVKNKLEDLSGVVIKPGDNPYDALIQACNDDPEKIQSVYSTHREKRNAQQKEKFLSPDFKELIIDPFLLRLEDRTIVPGFEDTRHCLVFWARPPDHIVRLATHVQQLLKECAPNIWLMPPHRMHMTTLEIAHSRTPSEIADLVAALRPAIPEITCFPATQHARSLASVAGVERGSGTPGESTNSRGKAARLVRPMVSYDLSAFALSFVPATSKQPVLSPPPVPIPVPAPASPSASPTTSLATTTVGPATASTPTGHGSNNDPDAYTYHHLRRDIYELASRAGASSGVTIASRYVVPSAHVTLGRYLTEADHGTPEARLAWVRKIEEVNDWLEREVWDGGSGSGDGEWIGEWIVGQEKGLDARCGALWYGGGRTIMLGEGF